MTSDPHEPRRWATCGWCRVTVPLGDAINAGWTPEWWAGDVWHGVPACPACAAEHLEPDAAGEMALKPGHPLPEEDAP